MKYKKQLNTHITRTKIQCNYEKSYLVKLSCAKQSCQSLLRQHKQFPKVLLVSQNYGFGNPTTA